MRQLKKIHKKGEYWLNKNCKQCIEGSTNINVLDDFLVMYIEFIKY